MPERHILVIILTSPSSTTERDVSVLAALLGIGAARCHEGSPCPSEA